ncbi:hypothetical protein SNE40_003423 [Patella caerulea]|uniref:Right handed beta helix domain-containing protein n=1 Tax=Patella caerulea TaxID=87958 RepID=A0AAN8K9S6_PATCE
MTVPLYVLIILFIHLDSGNALSFFVSPIGKDTNTGLEALHPLKTIQAAIQKISRIHNPTGEIIVELMQGYHDLESTLKIYHGFPLPVIFRAYLHSEVHVTGGKRIQSDQFKHVTDNDILKRLPSLSQSKVLQVHLPSVGITDFGDITRYGYGYKRTAPLEVFINEKALRLAEWPNSNFIDIKTIPKGRYGMEFTYDHNNDSLWALEKEPWSYGYWYASWADGAIEVSKINPETHTINLAYSPGHGLSAGPVPRPGHFRVINMLCELDQPGEYYVDRSSGILYIWPNTHSGLLTSDDIVYVSLMDDCIDLGSGVQHVRFEDFTLEYCRHYGIFGQNIHDMKIRNMEISNTGSFAVVCNHDCRNVEISRCDIHHTDGGIYMSGGDVRNLISSGNIIYDNHIWQFSRVSANGANAIEPNGVNIIFRYNHIHDGQYMAVMWHGNDHMMEYNNIHHVCMNSSDCGALNIGASWTYRGCMIRYNHIHHVLQYWPGAEVRGLMLDDLYSSVTIEHNVMYDNSIHINIGGGRDNIIRGNVLYNASKRSINLDGRGLLNMNNQDRLTSRLAAVPYTGPLWSSRYPKLAAMVNATNKRAPEGNQIYNNIIYNQPGVQNIRFYQKGINRKDYFDVHDQYESTDDDADFISTTTSDFRLKGKATEWANKINFEQPIVLKDIGPRYPTGPSYKQNGMV